MLRFTKITALIGLVAFPFFVQAADKLFMESTELKCVADGVEIATEGPNHSEGLRPSEKYLALLGFAAQKNYKYVNAAKGGWGREIYLERVIQMIQANGFCVANQVDGNGVPTSRLGYGDIVRDKKNKAAPYLIYAVTGLKSNEKENGDTQSALKTKEMKEVVKYFGFQDESYIQDLFRNDYWLSLQPEARQKLFSSNVHPPTPAFPENQTSHRGMYTPDENGEGLKDCFSQIKLMQSKDTIFNFKNGKNGRRPDNNKFCETIAKECNLENTSFCSVSATENKGSSSGKGPGGGSIFDGVKGRQ